MYIWGDFKGAQPPEKNVYRAGWCGKKTWVGGVKPRRGYIRVTTLIGGVLGGIIARSLNKVGWEAKSVF
jgi:hypothetical protein